MIKKNIQETTVDLSDEDLDYIENAELVDFEGEESPLNTMGEVFQALKRALLTLRNPDNTPFFKTIAVDTGQYDRLISKQNTEFETAFPACFIRFVDVHFLVSQQNISDGRCTARIRFVLNRLDNQHRDWETFGFYIAEKINKAVQKAKETELALQSRCNLQYFDMPQTANMLQAYWIDYEIYFTLVSSSKYIDWIKRRIIMPPFTNNSDAGNDKPDVEVPTYNDSSTIKEIQPTEEPEAPEEPDDSGD